MGYESVTDEKINQLVAMKKRVTNPNARKSDKGAHYQYNGALHCLTKDCNIQGLSAKPDLPSLFD